MKGNSYAKHLMFPKDQCLTLTNFQTIIFSQQSGSFLLRVVGRAPSPRLVSYSFPELSLIYFKRITKFLIILREILQYKKQRGKLKLSNLRATNYFQTKNNGCIQHVIPTNIVKQTELDSMAVKLLINLLK